MRFQFCLLFPLRGSACAPRLWGCQIPQLLGHFHPLHGRATELNMAVFLLACIVNVQYVSLQLFKHGQKTWSRVQAAVTPPSPTNPNVAPKDPLSFPFFCKEIIVSVIIYSSLFTIQSVKMSNKNKYQCYSSWSIQYNRSLPFLIEMLSEIEFHLGIFPEI